MNYLKLYCKLIRKFEERGLTRKEAKKQGLYVEGHHIFPQSIYGKSSKGNKRIVYLTAREHYLIHAILEKAFVQRYGVGHWKTAKMTKAHINMACDGGFGKEKKEFYCNSHLYEAARIRMSINNSGKNNCRVLKLRIHFEDGRVIDWDKGAEEFCKENPQYCSSSIGAVRRGERERHLDITKVEVLNPERIRKEPSKSAIPVRIYFADGRVEDSMDGISNFCRRNPTYKVSGVTEVKTKKKRIHKDIIKVEELDPNNITEPIPIIKELYNAAAIPVKIYFEDGKVIEHQGGKVGFCRDNPQYTPANLTRVQSGKTNQYKDIIKVELLDKKLQQKRATEYKKRAKSFNIRIYFADGRIVHYNKGFYNFCLENPEYDDGSMNRLLIGKIRFHKDMLKIEKYDPENPGNPQPSIKKHWNDCIPVRIHFANGTYIDWYEGLNEFTKQNPQYNRIVLHRIKKGTQKTHKDIVKVEEIDPNNLPEFVPIFMEDLINPDPRVKPIRIHFEDGKTVDWYESKSKFCKKHPQYNDEGIRRVQTGERKRHRDIIKVETINTPTTSQK